MNKFHGLVRLGVVLAALVGFAALLPSQLQAQTYPSGPIPYFGSVVGTVTGTSKAVIPNATVTLTNLVTTEVRTERTDADGKYKFIDVVPDEDYKVTVEAANFKRFVSESVRVAQDAVVHVDPVMTKK